ncbi:unnamed protein product, partial [Closterium sp. NIES-53]
MRRWTLICQHALPLDERVHFGQLKTAKELYDAVVARYSSPSTTALGHLRLHGDHARGSPGRRAETGGVGVARAGDPTEPRAARARGAGAVGAGAGGIGAGVAGAGAVDPRARGARGIVRPRPYFVPLLQQ